MSNSNTNEISENNPRDLNSLLRLAIQNTDTSQPPSSNNRLDAETMEWLRNALSSMTTDVSQILRDQIDILKQLAEEGKTRILNEEDIEKMEDICEKLGGIISYIDFAIDFCKLGGLKQLHKLIELGQEEITIKCFDMIAEIIQNNEFCQQEVINSHLLPVILRHFNKEFSEKVKVKALYATSCLVRGNEAVQILFESKYNGFSLLLKLIEENLNSPKLRIKVSFLLSNLCQQRPEFKKILCNMGYVELVVALLHREYDASHEHLLSTLLAISSDNPQAIKECQRPEFNLEHLLKQKIQDLGNKEESKEEIEYCNELLNLCFSRSETITKR